MRTVEMSAHPLVQKQVASKEFWTVELTVPSMVLRLALRTAE